VYYLLSGLICIKLLFNKKKKYSMKKNDILELDFLFVAISTEWKIFCNNLFMQNQHWKTENHTFFIEFAECSRLITIIFQYRQTVAIRNFSIEYDKFFKTSTSKKTWFMTICSVCSVTSVSLLSGITLSCFVFIRSYVGARINEL
jgi:hypothetical protein